MHGEYSKRWVVVLLASGLLLAGCGQKGPLYLPEKEAETRRTTDTEKERDTESAAPQGVRY